MLKEVSMQNFQEEDKPKKKKRDMEETFQH